MNPQSQPKVQSSQGVEQHIDDSHLQEVSVLALLLRVIPVMISFLLFILAVSVDADRWGSRGIQLIIAIAIFFGFVGVALFIPKKI